MLVQMYVERIGVAHFPFDDTVTCKSAVVVDQHVMGQIFPGRDGWNGVHIVARFLDPGVFVRPEELYRVALTQTVLVLRDMGLVRTHDNMHRIHFAAVVDNRVGRDLDTDPFALPFVHFLAVRVKSRMNRVAYVYRHGFLADEDRVAVIYLEVRNNRQVYLYDRVAAAGCQVPERRQPSFAIRRIQVLALSYHIRKVVLAYRVETENVVRLVDLDIDVEDRVAGMRRIIRSYLNTVHKGRVFGVYLIAPHGSVDVATVDINGRVVRLRDRQVQRMELGDLAFRIIDRIGIDTRCVVVLLVLFPEIRIALVDMYRLRGIDLADCHNLRLLLNDIEDADTVAYFFRLRSVPIFTAGGDMVLVPVQRLAVTQNYRLVVYFLARYGDNNG